MEDKKCSKRKARNCINEVKQFYNENSLAMMKYHRRYCQDKLLRLENMLSDIVRVKKKFKFKNIKRPQDLAVIQRLRENKIEGQFLLLHSQSYHLK